MLSRWPEPIPNKKIPLGRACDQSVGEEIAEIGSRPRVRRAIRGCEYLAVACDGAFRWGKGQVGSSFTTGNNRECCGKKGRWSWSYNIKKSPVVLNQ